MDRQFTLRDAMIWLTLAALVVWAWSGAIRAQFRPSLREQFKEFRAMFVPAVP